MKDRKSEFSHWREKNEYKKHVNYTNKKSKLEPTTLSIKSKSFSREKKIIMLNMKKEERKLC